MSNNQNRTPTQQPNKSGNEQNQTRSPRPQDDNSTINNGRNDRDSNQNRPDKDQTRRSDKGDADEDEQ